MLERTTSTNIVIAAALWTSTAALLIVAAIVMLGGYWKISLLVAEAACCLSAFAAVRHVRCYASKICRRIDDAALDRDVSRVMSSIPRQKI
jgi:hypothetical protein